MLWGFDGFTRGMNESDARFRKKRSENVKLFTEYKNLFPDAPIEDYQNFINETTEGSAYLKKQMPSSEALQSYVDRQELVRQREEENFERTALRDDLALSSEMRNQLSQLGPSVSTFEDATRALLGSFAPESKQFSAVSKWADSNKNTIMGTLKNSQLDFATKIANTTKDLSPAGIKAVAKDYGVDASPETISLALQIATENQTEDHRKKSLSIYNAVSNDKVLMDQLSSTDPQVKARGVEQLKSLYMAQGVPFKEDNPATGEAGTAYRYIEKSRAKALYDEPRNAENAETKAYENPMFNSVVSSLSGKTREQQIDLIKGIVPNVDINDTQKTAIAKRILKNAMELSTIDQRKKTQDVVGIISKMGDVDESSIRATLGNTYNKEVIDQAIKIHKANRVIINLKEQKDWQRKSIESSRTVAAFSSTNSKDVEAELTRRKREAEANGWTFDTNYWSDVSQSLLQERQVGERIKFNQSFTEMPLYKKAIAAAQNNNPAGAITMITKLVDGTAMSKTDKNDIIAKLLATAEIEVGTGMNKVYEAQVQAQRTSAAKDWIAQQKTVLAEAKMDGAYAALLFDEDIDLAKSTDASYLGTRVSSYINSTGVPATVMIDTLRQLAAEKYKGEEGLKKLNANFIPIMSAEIKAKYGKLPNSLAQRSKYITDRVGMVVVKPQQVAELRGSLRTIGDEIAEAKQKLQTLWNRSDPASVGKYGEKKNEILGSLKTKLSQIKRFVDNAKVIAVEDVDDLTEQYNVLQKRIAEYSQVMHPQIVVEQEAKRTSNEQQLLSLGFTRDDRFGNSSIQKHRDALQEAEKALTSAERRAKATRNREDKKEAERARVEYQAAGNRIQQFMAIRQRLMAGR